MAPSRSPNDLLSSTHLCKDLNIVVQRTHHQTDQDSLVIARRLLLHDLNEVFAVPAFVGCREDLDLLCRLRTWVYTKSSALVRFFPTSGTERTSPMKPLVRTISTHSNA